MATLQAGRRQQADAPVAVLLISLVREPAAKVETVIVTRSGLGSRAVISAS